MCGLAQRTWREDRQPIACIPPRAPPQMGKLDHHSRALVMHLAGKTGHMRGNLVPIGQEIAKGGWAVAADHGRARRHGQRNASTGAFHMIGAIGIGG